MLIKRLGGKVYSDGEAYSGGDKVEVLFEADGAIPVGTPCTLDITANTLGTLVVASETANDHAFIGVYEGRGGSGAEATISGLTGRAAVDGDVIYLTAYGVAETLCDGTTTDIAAGNALSLAEDAAEFTASAAVDAGVAAKAIALEALTTATGNIAVFVRAL